MTCRDCRDYEHLLPLFADSSLSEQERTRLLQHLKECKGCADEADDFCQLVRLLGRTRRVQEPADLHARLMCRLDREEETRHRVFWVPMFAGGAVAAAAVILVVLLVRPQLGKNVLTDGLRAAVPAPSAVGTLSPSSGVVAYAAKEPLGTGPKAQKLAHHALSASSRPQPAAKEVTTTLETSSADEAQATDTEALASEARGTGSGIPFSRPVAFSQTTLYSAAPERSEKTQPTGAAAAAAARGVSRSRPTEWSGGQCAVSRPATLLARTPEELTVFWAKTGIAPVTVDVVSRRSMLAGLFLGQQTGGGVELHVTTLEEQPNRILVRYRMTRIAEIQTTPSASAPYLLILLPYSPLPVNFVEEP
jgi:hypothetical protein